MNSFFVDINGKIHHSVLPDIHIPLDAIGVAATLNAVLGVWTLADAANVANLTEQDLINEALSWEAASNGE